MSAIGFIGLGAMGSRMATRLLEAGHNMVVFNRSPEKAAPLVEAGAVVASSPAEAARGADVVITMVADPEALRSVTEGPEGLAAGVAPTATVIEMSTVGPDAVARMAGSLPTSTGVLDAPVLGSIGEAAAGTLRIFVGGDADLVARWAPLLGTLGEPIHVGPLGSGAAAKLVANSTLFGVLAVLGEAVALADGLGLSREAAMEVLATTPVADQARRRAPVLAGEDQPTRFTLSLAVKDAELMLAAARHSGVELRLAPAAARWLADADAAGAGDADYSSVLGTIAGGRA